MLTSSGLCVGNILFGAQKVAMSVINEPVFLLSQISVALSFTSPDDFFEATSLA